MIQTNKHGLSRTIPLNVKRLVRQKSGFGCVICGNGITEYEHFDPEFADAKSHDANGITLLCPNHHTEKTKGILPKEYILDAIQEPAALKKGFSKGIFYIGNGYPRIQFAGSLITNCPTPIMIKGIPIFTITPSQTAGEPYMLSANLFDSKGNNTLNIVNNEWQSSSDNWDVEVVQNRITIREKKGEIALEIQSNSPDTITINKINMRIDDYHIQGNSQRFFVNTVELSNCIADNCSIGFSFG